MRTSELLEQGRVYTRQELRDRFGIADKTLDTGIFKPRNHDSVWLFVTEKKSPGQTAYEDRFDGDTLHWQGQTAGLKDALVIEHATRGLELVLFYRERNDAYPGYGFRFEGPFVYISHSGAGPTTFILHRARTDSQQPDSNPAELARPKPEVDPDQPLAGNRVRCVIDVLAQLRQSGRDAVVAEGNVTSIQQQMHVHDAIEDWIAGRVVSWREAGRPVPLLIVLSGNAGDGKSDLVERLRRRPEVSGSDLEVIADATHSDSPSQSQADRLASAFAPFETESVNPKAGERSCVLVAMNVGMVIAFFAELRGSSDEQRFSALQGVLEASLGLSAAAGTQPSHWQCEVINLDHRNVLGVGENGLFEGMLRKLDPEQPGSLTHEAAKACETCGVRGACWVRSNLSLLRLDEVHVSLHELLWQVTLGSDVHLSPRNLWDLLFQVTTGGLEIRSAGGEEEFLSREWIEENLPPNAREFSAEELSLVHRRLLYHLLFEPAEPGTLSRGPLLDALTGADPIRSGGKHTHLAEGEVRAAPRADAESLSILALQATEPDPELRGQHRPDPLLDGLASLVTDPLLWHENEYKNATQLALGVSRRARVTGLPPEIQAEVSDPDISEFLRLLHAYAAWEPGQKAPPEVNGFWVHKLVGGVGQIFGVDVQGKMYFRLDTLSPTTRFPAYVPVDLHSKLSIRPDAVVASAAPWLASVAYMPRKVTATIDAGGDHPWAVPVDLQLYRLLSHVSRGYAASSVDLEAFFRLRYACERLGATDEEGEIVFRALDSGEILRLHRQQQLTGWETEFTRVSTT